MIFKKLNYLIVGAIIGSLIASYILISKFSSHSIEEIEQVEEVKGFPSVPALVEPSFNGRDSVFTVKAYYSEIDRWVTIFYSSNEEESMNMMRLWNEEASSK